MQLTAHSDNGVLSRAELPRVIDLLEQLQHGVCIVDGHGVSEYRNAQAEALLGPATDGAFVAHVAGTGEVYPATRLPVNRALGGETSRVDDIEMWRPDDRVVLEVVARPLVEANDTPAGALLILVDVTARTRLRETRRELRAAQGRFQVAQEKAPMGLAMVGLDLRFTDVNAFLCRLSGRSREELIGLRPADLLDPDDAEHHRALNDALLAEGTDDYTETVEFVRGVGDAVSVDVTVGMIRDEAGLPIHQIMLFQDVTERLDHERLVAELNVALSGRGTDLERANVHLERLNRDLLRSNRDLEQFAYIASHDLSEPLRSVTGYVQLLAKRYRGQLDSDADQFIDYAVDGVNRMQTLIRDLLAYARADVGSEVVAVDCAELVADVVEVVGAAYPSATFDVGSMPTVVSAPTQLRQVFDNLISNAVKFAPADQPARVVVSAHVTTTETQFTIADNGIGIEEHHQERIFGMFQRLHARSDYPGTGIGLAICRRVVERLGGTISVESTVGAGTRFTFSVPAPAGVGA